MVVPVFGFEGTAAERRRTKSPFFYFSFADQCVETGLALGSAVVRLNGAELLIEGAEGKGAAF